MEFNPNAGFRFWFSGYQYGKVTVIGGEMQSAVESYPANAPIELKQFVQRG
ncbi:MAG: hypothetical protein OXH03_04870 [Bacteroidetes bacterium]|nr:hypothetical protein [Bacteroidota bacterium]MDE2672311.1 hypothetical protein [Bacteroidota bacterium]